MGRKIDFVGYLAETDKKSQTIPSNISAIKAVLTHDVSIYTSEMFPVTPSLYTKSEILFSFTPQGHTKFDFNCPPPL